MEYDLDWDNLEDASWYRNFLKVVSYKDTSINTYVSKVNRNDKGPKYGGAGSDLDKDINMPPPLPPSAHQRKLQDVN